MILICSNLSKKKKFIRIFITSVEWKQFLCPKTALIYGAKTSFLNHYSCIDDCLGVGYNDNHTCWLIAAHFWGYFHVYLFTKHGITIKRTSQKPLLTFWHWCTLLILKKVEIVSINPRRFAFMSFAIHTSWLHTQKYKREQLFLLLMSEWSIFMQKGNWKNAKLFYSLTRSSMMH